MKETAKPFEKRTLKEERKWLKVSRFDVKRRESEQMKAFERSVMPQSQFGT